MCDITQQEIGKQVAVQEQTKKLELQSSRPTTRPTKLKQGWIQQMKDSILDTILQNDFRPHERKFQETKRDISQGQGKEQ